MSKKEQPNVLLINADHWAASEMGCAGNSVIMTPTLNQLAETGVRFDRFFSPSPVCVPARRSLMTGMTAKHHGDREATATLRMPAAVTMPQAFRNAGYQAYAVGKLHVYPQRDRIGFDDVILSEEARYNFGIVDDYQIWLGENGYLGKEYAHGMSNNQYYTRPWHLPEEAHQTNWVTKQMVNMIKRKDPTRPAFFYASYVHPHPPLVPLQVYWDMYKEAIMPTSPQGDWVNDQAQMLRKGRKLAAKYTDFEIERAKKAFYALCTHIDHQIRLLIGTLREEGLLENTIVAFTSDHGDSLFDHGLIAKRNFYRNTTNVPFLISGRPIEHFGTGLVSSKLAASEDIMPTLLSACGIEVPKTVDGLDLFNDEQERADLFGEVTDGPLATRMVTDGHFKLIYYPSGNVTQLFDLDHDPDDLKNLYQLKEYQTIQNRLIKRLIENLHDGDEKWAIKGTLVGEPLPPVDQHVDYGLHNQRGLHWPAPGKLDGGFTR